jgi:DNA-binding transcriptional LysR family regulator
MNSLSPVTIEDFAIILMLSQVQSVRELARRVKQDPGNVSRRLKWLETQFGVPLLDRGSAGVNLTESAKTLLPRMQQIIDICSDIQGSQSSQLGRINLGAPSFINARVLSTLLGHLNDGGSLAINLLDIPPDEILSHGATGAIDVALHFGKLKWPKTWISKPISSVPWILVASSAHPLADRSQVSEFQVLKYPFAYPLYWTNVGMVYGDDFCPASKSVRRVGAGTATAETALGAVLGGSMIGFLPKPVVAEKIRQRHLVEVRVKDWPSVSKTLFVAARSSSVSQSFFLKLKTAVSDCLSSL